MSGSPRKNSGAGDAGFGSVEEGLGQASIAPPPQRLDHPRSTVRSLRCGGCLKTPCQCWFWAEWRSKKDRPEVARIAGEHYFVLPRVDPAVGWLGFDGREFRIRFHDGREVETNNLCWQGVIPEPWRHSLPDNAVFVGERAR